MNGSIAVESKPLTWAQILDEYRSSPKMKASDGEDAAIIAKVRHTMKPKERLLQWFARVGLGKPQIMAMSKDEISAFVRQAAVARSSEPLPPPELFEPKRPPMKFLIDTFNEQ